MSIRDLIRYTVMPETRLDALANLMGAAPAAGCFVQCGVGDGGSAAAIASADGTLADEGRPYFLFDSFEGMPKSGPRDGSKAYHKGRARTWCKGDPQNVKKIFALLKLPEPMIVVGMIEDTLPITDTGSISVLHLDVDWYEATMLALSILAPRVGLGGLIIVDDYGHWEGARKACDEYLLTHGDRYGPMRELLPGGGDPTRFWVVDDLDA